MSHLLLYAVSTADIVPQSNGKHERLAETLHVLRGKENFPSQKLLYLLTPFPYQINHQATVHCYGLEGFFLRYCNSHAHPVPYCSCQEKALLMLSTLFPLCYCPYIMDNVTLNKVQT